MEEIIQRLLEVVPDLKAAELAYIFELDISDAEKIIEEEGKESNIEIFRGRS